MAEETGCPAEIGIHDPRWNKHVTPEQHAQVKAIFLRAVELTEAERPAFLQAACGDDAELRREVETLLRYHDPATILTPKQVADTVSSHGQQVPAERPNPQKFPPVQPVRPESETYPSELGLRPIEATKKIDRRPRTKRFRLEKLWRTLVHGTSSDEQLVRQRLRVILGLYGLGFGLSFLHPLTDDPDWLIRIPLMLGLLGLFGLLCTTWQLTLGWLRVIEGLMLANVACQATIVDLRPLIDAAARGDAMTLMSAYYWNFAVWSMLILVYGVYMPNSWERASCILIPAALIPNIESALLRWWIPAVDAALDQDQFGMPVPLTLIAAVAGILAAHLIHTERQEADQARRFAQYRLKRLLGCGGMGEVYEAEHLLLKRPCAIKLIQHDRDRDPATLARFEREVQATARLTHWHTVEIYDYGQTEGGLFYYVMELLPGMSLADLVHRFGPLPPARAVHFLRQACEALQEAHSLGLVHRDIKPANLFAARRGGIDDVTKLLDFGLVRNTAPSHDPQLTAINTIGGTPAYMSPEQADPTRTVDDRSDLYSLGAVGYFLVTGHAPFEEPTALGTILAHIRQPVTPPSQWGPLPRDLEVCLLKSLEKEPQHRFASARAFEEALAACSCAGQWTREEAAHWWRTHGDPASPTDHSLAPTQTATARSEQPAQR